MTGHPTRAHHPDAPRFIRATLLARVEEFRGVVLGRSRTLDDIQLTEHWDIELPNLYVGMRFLDYVHRGSAQLAGPVFDLNIPVVFRVRVDGSFDEDRTPGE